MLRADLVYRRVLLAGALIAAFGPAPRAVGRGGSRGSALAGEQSRGAT